MSIQTVSLETAKMLKEEGFRQDAIFNWCIPQSEFRCQDPHVPHQFDCMTNKKLCSAPTSDELFEELPMAIEINKGLKYRVSYYMSFKRDNVSFLRESLPECLAQMWLWLKKEKLI